MSPARDDVDRERVGGDPLSKTDPLTSSAPSRSQRTEPNLNATDPLSRTDPLDQVSTTRSQVTEPALNVTAPMDPPRDARKDTMPDGQAAMRSLLDGLLPKDGRAVPPRAIAEMSAQSAGKDFVAYAGQARPVEGHATPVPVDAVIVMQELADMARAPTETVPPTAPTRPAELEATHPGGKTSSGLAFLVAIALSLLIVGITAWLRSSEEPAHPVGAPAATPVGGTPTAAPAPPSSSTSAVLAAPATVPDPAPSSLAPPAESVRSLRPVPSAAHSPNPADPRGPSDIYRQVF